MAGTASGATENFGLSQWVRSDAFNLDDFNADNSKIDAAIACRAQMAAGSYVGTGTYGSSNPCTLTFDFEPKLVMIYAESMGALTGNYSEQEVSYTIIAAGGATKSTRCGNSGAITTPITDYFTWNDKSLSWWSVPYYSSSYTPTGRVQLNESGTTYYYIAIG
ncbi:MAG: hypothetical protein ACI3VB_03570 [Oscillospiraceae bacterium]